MKRRVALRWTKRRRRVLSHRLHFHLGDVDKL
jgi:hypothetical protein